MPVQMPAPALPVNSSAPSGTGGAPAMRQRIAWEEASDRFIRGAAAINPAYAATLLTFKAGITIEAPRNNGSNAPLMTESKPVSKAQATSQGPNAWKKRTAPAGSDAIRFGGNPPQKLFAANAPWHKAFIPPLSLFNDASQWVNRLMFNRPMTPWGGGDSDPALKGQYFTPPPINTNNLAAGTLNAQLQLGNLAIQTQQLTLQASTYFGGS